jgi:hypothetical protein
LRSKGGSLHEQETQEEEVHACHGLDAQRKYETDGRDSVLGAPRRFGGGMMTLLQPSQDAAMMKASCSLFRSSVQ